MSTGSAFECNTLSYLMTDTKGVYEFKPVAVIIVDSVVTNQIDIGQHPLTAASFNVVLLLYEK